jgi:hypothetical protein
MLKISITNININFLIFNFKKYLIVGKKNSFISYYIELEKFFIFKIDKFFLILNNNNKKVNFYKISFFLQHFKKFYQKILIFKGLGLKLHFNDSLRILKFRLGFSHSLELKVDNEIGIGIKKNFLYLQSLNKENLGNFSFRIKSLKIPDSYRGKGVWYKNEKISLKQLKKK